VFKYRVKAIPITEERVKLINEVITAMKLVKMYAWEKAFDQKILGIIPAICKTFTHILQAIEINLLTLLNNKSKVFLQTLERKKSL